MSTLFFISYLRSTLSIHQSVPILGVRIYPTHAIFASFHLIAYDSSFMYFLCITNKYFNEFLVYLLFFVSYYSLKHFSHVWRNYPIATCPKLPRAVRIYPISIYSLLFYFMTIHAVQSIFKTQILLALLYVWCNRLIQYVLKVGRIWNQGRKPKVSEITRTDSSSYTDKSNSLIPYLHPLSPWLYLVF